MCKVWILEFGDFGFWILGILDFGDFGFWILDFGDLGFWILDWGFWMGTLWQNFGCYIRKEAVHADPGRRIFQMGWFNHQLVCDVYVNPRPISNWSSRSISSKELVVRLIAGGGAMFCSLDCLSKNTLVFCWRFPRPGVVGPLPNGRFMAYKRGWS